MSNEHLILNTPEGIERFRRSTIASACRMYARTGLKPNRHWTPSAMLRAAGEITGKKYKRGQHMQAHDDIRALLRGPSLDS